MKKVLLFPFFILLAAFFLRWDTLWLPHWQGDQSQYIALAMKLSKTSFDWNSYNLREVDIKLDKKNINGTDHSILMPKYKPGQLGLLIPAYYVSGFGYYDIPIFYKAPLLPMILVLSHKFLSPDKENFKIVRSNLHSTVSENRSWELAKIQLWASVIPLFFSLAVIFLIFLIGWKLFNLETGIYASWIFAINPVDIMTASRVITEDLFTFLILLSALIYGVAIKRHQLWVSLLAGLSMGLAILTNQKSLIFVPIISLLPLAIQTNVFSKQNIKKYIYLFMFYVIGVLIISGPWLYLMWETYGNPIHQPKVTAEEIAKMDWNEFLRNRPNALIFYFIGGIYICPPLIGALFILKRSMHELKDLIKKVNQSYPLTYLWIWTLPLLLYYIIRSMNPLSITGIEHRYMLPVYPATVLLSGFMFYKLRVWITPHFRKPQMAHVAVGSMLVLCVFWCLPLALEIVYAERSLFIDKPF